MAIYGLDDQLSVKTDSLAARMAREAVECFQPYGRDEQRYARAQFTLDDSCREPLIRLLSEIRKKALNTNLRATHMMETLNRLLGFHGPDTKAIVWEHNTHIGDARYTDMKKSRMINVGQLAREQCGVKMEVMPVPKAKAGSRLVPASYPFEF